MRRQIELFKDTHKTTGTQIIANYKGRHQPNAVSLNQRLAQNNAVIRPESAADFDSYRLASRRGMEGPLAWRGRQAVDQAAVLPEVRWSRWLACLVKIGGSRTSNAVNDAEPSRGKRG